MGLFIYDPTIRISTPLSVNLQRRTITELAPTAATAAIRPRNTSADSRFPYARQHQASDSGEQDTARSTTLTNGCAADIMTPGVVCIDQQATWQEARHMFNAHGVHHLVVTDQSGQVAGLLTEQDLLSYPDCPGITTPNGLPTSLLASATPDTDLAAIAFFMIERKSDAIAVVRGESIEGIITLRDFLKAFLNPSLVEAWV